MKANENLPIHKPIDINLQRWQIVVALTSPLDVHVATKWYATQEHCYFTGATGKQINAVMLQTVTSEQKQKFPNY